MKIVRAKIFGFGKWVDMEIEFPSEGPFIIFGENESGKSTFHQFILFMLFGMPPRQRKWYQPKTSSKMGGHLVMSDSEIGEFTIERFDHVKNGEATCMTATGEVYGEDWLRERLQGMNKDTFDSIFSFSALDLNGIKDMHEEELSDVLLSIGLTGSSNVYRVEKQLETRLGELFKPNGKNPTINQQLQLLQQLKKELAAIQQEEATYREKTMESQSLQDKLETLKNQQQELEKENKLLTKMRTAFPFLQEYKHLMSKRQAFQKSIDFPIHGVERLEKLKDSLRPLESEYAILRKNEDSYRSNLAEIDDQRLNQELIDELRTKLEQKQVYAKLIDKQQELQEVTAELKREISRELDELHIDLTQEELSEVSLPFYIEETWKQLKEDKERLAQETIRLEAEKRSLIEEEKYNYEQLEEKKAALLPETEITKIKQRLKQGKESIQLEAIYEANTQRKKNYALEKNKKIKQTNLYLITGIVIALLVSVSAIVLEQTFLFGLAAIIFLLSAGQNIFIKQNVKEMERVLNTPLEFESNTTLSEEEVLKLEQQLDDVEQIRNEMKQIQSDIQLQQIKFMQLEERERSLLEKEARLRQQFEEQYTSYPFLKNINSSYWLDYYHRLRKLLATNHEYEQHLRKLNEIGVELNQLEAFIISFVTELDSDHSISAAFEAFVYIEKRLENEMELKQRQSHYMELIKETEEKRSEIIERMNVHKREVTELLQAGHAQTEEEFYENAIYVADKAQFEKDVETNQRQLEVIFPDNRWESIIHEQLDELELSERQKELENNQHQNHKEIERTRALLAEVNAELNRLEGSEAYSQKMHQFELEKEKLNQLAKEWAIIKMEKEVLVETKQRYQTKYLSKVLEETTGFFSIITAGRYTTVLSPQGKQPFQVMSHDGVRYRVDELSHGTMNQLYVSLRLAISKVIAENHQLPFILDDAFVHFDELRVKRMMDVLQKIAIEQQMIMFSCKSDVVKACEELGISIFRLIGETETVKNTHFAISE